MNTYERGGCVLNQLFMFFIYSLSANDMSHIDLIVHVNIRVITF